MSDTKKELVALLSEARNQLPLAASCWNEDEDRELAERNVQHVLGLIKRIDEALTEPSAQVQGETPAPLRGEREAFEAWFTAEGDYELEWLDGSATSAGWLYSNADTENMWEAWRAGRTLAAPMPQSAGVTDERIRAIANECGMFSDYYENAPGEHCDRFARAVLALAPGLSGWQEIASAPKNRKVIVGYFNQLGKHRTVMASYYPAETLESEHTDSGWADEGWYEECESQSETIMPTDCEPTHWMPLPAAPGLAPHQPQPDAGFAASAETGIPVTAQPQPEGKPWDMKTAHEKAPELIAQLDEESERLTRYGGSGDALLNEAARVIEALTQPQPEPASKGEKGVGK